METELNLVHKAISQKSHYENILQQSKSYFRLLILGAAGNLVYIVSLVLQMKTLRNKKSRNYRPKTKLEYWHPQNKNCKQLR